MPISAEYDPKTRLLVISAEGVMTQARLAEAVRLLRDYANKEPVSGLLFDQSAVTEVAVSATEIRAMAELTRSLEEAQGVRMANVAPADVAFGMSRMYELVRNDGDNVRSFRDREAALRWLQEPPAV